jgi:hypothetical protein
MAVRPKTTTDPSPTQEPDAPLSLVAKLARIGAAVTTVEKKGYNDHHKYAYVREPELFEAVRGGLADAQIMILPCVTGLDRSPSLVTLQMDFQILDGQSGETLHIPWFAEGQDNSDKGINKALTAAMKYFIYKLFLIPTTDERGEYTDAENTRFSPEAAPTARVPAPVSMSNGATRIRKVDTRDGVNKNGPWVKYTLTFGTGHTAGFFVPDFKKPDAEAWGTIAKKAEALLRTSQGQQSVRVEVKTEPGRDPSFQDITMLTEVAEATAQTPPAVASAPESILTVEKVPF